MFSKALRALSSGTRDRDQHDSSSSPRRRATGPDAAHRQLQASPDLGAIDVTDSDSDEYGLPQVRKSSVSRQDMHRRTLSREQADVEYKCIGCGERGRYKVVDAHPACKYCQVRPCDSRRPARARPAPGQRLIRTPRHLEESFRNLYRRFGIMVREDLGVRSRQDQQHDDNAGLHDANPEHAQTPKISEPATSAIASPMQRHTNSNGARFRPPPIREAPRAPMAAPGLHPSSPTKSSTPRSGISHASPVQAHKATTSNSAPLPRHDFSPLPTRTHANTSPRKRLPTEGEFMAPRGGNESPMDRHLRMRSGMLEQFQDDLRSLLGNLRHLNTEFCSSVRPKLNKRSLSEGSNVSLHSSEGSCVRPAIPGFEPQKIPAGRFNAGRTLPSTSSPEPLLPDSKALLAGHIHDIVSSLADYGVPRQIERSSTITKRSTYQSSPHVNWPEWHAFSSVLNRHVLDIDYCFTLVTRNDDTLDQRNAIRAELVSFAGALLACCFNVMFELLISPFKEASAPQDARFLFMLLLIPWFSRPLDPLAHEFRQLQENGSITSSSPCPTRLDEEARKVFAVDVKNARSSAHIIDRCLSLILGRISQLPDTIQHAFARWFASIPSSTFADITNSVQGYNFIMIKDLPVDTSSRTLENNQAQDRGFLTEMLGAAQIDHFNKDSERLPVYSRKKHAWRLRASCQVMQLLVVANDIRKDSIARGWSTAGLSRQNSQVGGVVPFPNDHFCTPLLDPDAGRFNVAKDFELWDAHRAKFTLCQYPFLLTLGTKVKVLEYDNERRKKDAVRAEWHASKGMSADPYFHLPVRREHIIADSFKLIREARGSLSGVTSKKLRVYFEGEEGVDAGGPQKEWFLILTQDLFNPELGLFYLSDSGHFWFHSACNKPNEYYELVGAVFGLAIYNQTPLFAPFPPFLFKKLAAAAPRIAGGHISWRHMWRPTLQDYAELCPDFARILRAGLEDPTTMSGMDFAIPVWQNGQSIFQPLTSNGTTREIDATNIHEFVEKAVSWVLRDSINNQFAAFARGFHSICGGNALSLFRGEELELLVRGSEDFDLSTLRAAAVYDNWKKPGSTRADGEERFLTNEADATDCYPVIGFFWRFFERAEMAERRRILRFVTGTDRLPPAGIVNLVIKVSRLRVKEGQMRFPSARTCFNQLLLPDCFTEEDTFARWMDEAVREGMEGGFGLK